MRWLIIFGVVGAIAWWLRTRLRGRDEARGVQAPPADETSRAPSPMVVCRHCGVHIPHHECVRGALGPYCSTAHMQQAEH